MQLNSRRFSTFALSLVLFGAAGASHAQPIEYEAQRLGLNATRFDTLDELRALAQAYKGRIVELRGSVKGVFSRGAGFSMMLQLQDNQTLLLDAPATFKGNSAARPGATVRMLCRVEGVDGKEVLLTVVGGTDKVDNSPVVRRDDDDNIPAALANTLKAPAPSDVIVAREVVIGERISSPTVTTSSVPVSSSAQVRPRGSNLSSRSLPRPRSATNSVVQPQAQSATNPYYGFGDEHRAAYKSLASRNNPRLSDDMADYIAGSLLEAAQSNNLDPRFLAAVVQVESRFDPYAVSNAGAMGLGQLMPFNLKPLGVQNAWDPRQNLSGAAKLLRTNLNTYSREPNGTLLAVAAYHAGVGAVNRAGKAVPKVTTQRYVWKVYYAYRALAPELFR